MVFPSLVILLVTCTVKINIHADTTLVNCPCAKCRGVRPLKDHYYCESGATNQPGLTTFHGSDPLWDGLGCPAGDIYCSALETPWFYRHFIKPENRANEVRICRDEVYSNEATLVEQVALYIQ